MESFSADAAGFFGPLLASKLFWFAVAGGLAAEGASILLALKDRQTPPERCKHVLFWVTLLGVALFAGVMAIEVYKVDTPLLAVHIGASAPLILKALSGKSAI